MGDCPPWPTFNKLTRRGRLQLVGFGVRVGRIEYSGVGFGACWMGPGIPQAAEGADTVLDESDPKVRLDGAKIKPNCTILL